VKTLGLIVREIAFRRVNFLLALLAVTVSVALFVSSVTTGRASERETIRLMRDLGLNLRVIPRGTDMNAFWDQGFSNLTMPEEYAAKLAAYTGFTSNHISATLIRRIEWRGKTAILTGVGEEVFPPGKKKPPMVPVIAPGHVYVGRELAQSLGVNRGDRIAIEEKKFTVSGIGHETGTADDIRLQVHLADAQEVLGLTGRINEIRAIECLCLEPEQDTLAGLRAELRKVLPDTEVFQLEAMAKARREQRVMVRAYILDIVLPSVVVVCAVWIAVLALLNVRERRVEIGVLRALGHGSGRVAALFLGRAVLIGLLGALIGFAAGTFLALEFGPDIFRVTAKAIKPDYTLLLWSLAAAPALAALASLVPASLAVTQDPAASLRQE
jgi:putative ABC transport system permease protein